MKVKQKSVRSLKDKVWPVFSLYIRMRDCLRTTGKPDWGICITCGEPRHIKDADAGHFIQGRHNSILFDETCVHFQCRSCNRFKGGRQLEYRRAIIQLYGEGYDEELERRNNQTKHFTIEELEKLLDYYKQKAKELEVNEKTILCP